MRMQASAISGLRTTVVQLSDFEKQSYILYGQPLNPDFSSFLLNLVGERYTLGMLKVHHPKQKHKEALMIKHLGLWT